MEKLGSVVNCLASLVGTGVTTSQLLQLQSCLAYWESICIRMRSSNVLAKMGSNRIVFIL